MIGKKITFGNSQKNYNIGGGGIEGTNMIDHVGNGNSLQRVGQNIAINNAAIRVAGQGIGSPGYGTQIRNISHQQFGSQNNAHHQKIRSVPQRYEQPLRYETRIEERGVTQTQNIYQQNVAHRPAHVFSEPIVQPQTQILYRDTFQQPVQIYRQTQAIQPQVTLIQQNKISNTQYNTSQIRQQKRPFYQKLYNNTTEIRRKQADDVESPEKKNKCCSSCCWILWVLLGLAALTLGLLFGLGVFNSWKGPDFDPNFNTNIKANGTSLNTQFQPLSPNNTNSNTTFQIPQKQTNRTKPKNQTKMSTGVQQQDSLGSSAFQFPLQQDQELPTQPQREKKSDNSTASNRTSVELNPRTAFMYSPQNGQSTNKQSSSGTQATASKQNNQITVVVQETVLKQVASKSQQRSGKTPVTNLNRPSIQPTVTEPIPISKTDKQQRVGNVGSQRVTVVKQKTVFNPIDNTDKSAGKNSSGKTKHIRRGYHHLKIQ